MGETITKRKLQGFIDRLAQRHMLVCGTGYMLCRCEFGHILRDMNEVARRKRRVDFSKQKAKP